ncbi:MAG: hypothetical protein HOC22_05425 [Cryomorphaceae bacterium]|jgi:hypothetical protein|nr:hypothetical protein [Cryomorphaceae bacterium]MDG1889414.1 hypothetical protein [Flavobacteriaceae bacterium]MBT3503583.1 hypothetical protein [Cryomorphaceae bacterium]MBT3689143.1 hypothetical protein [Cryomorphaceae bacterium]MBT4222225.1 hypothetical protein [Cryomorphaceae bacterium]|tara:strand:+ start:51 stop:644 length:594 start_codon:yes stop_codon:yes gene_type:complete
MKRFILSSLFISLIVTACSKDAETPTVEIVDEFEQIYSCVSYDDLLDPKNTNQDDLMQYWTKFVEDVKCSRGGPDYSERNPSLNIFFEYRSAAQISAGVTPDHIAYSTFSGYCNDNRVNVGVLYNEWTEKNLLQRLWIMYHEFGHDVYKYEHSTNPADIMYPSSTRSDINVNDFIEAKDRLFKRSFTGIKYISCPGE